MGGEIEIGLIFVPVPPVDGGKMVDKPTVP
jgi:hypothetical protein